MQLSRETTRRMNVQMTGKAGYVASICSEVLLDCGYSESAGASSAPEIIGALMRQNPQLVTGGQLNLALVRDC
jgi:hypothetical protein